MSWDSSSYQMVFSRFPSSFNQSIQSSSNQLGDVLMPSGYSTPLMQSPAYPQSTFDQSQFSQSEIKEEDGEKKRGKALLRRYKTPSPQVLRMRRCAANERERKRMTTLNTAYDKLRTALPEYDSGRRLSKYDTLRLAQEYIAKLDEILHNNHNRNHNHSSK